MLLCVSGDWSVRHYLCWCLGPELSSVIDVVLIGQRFYRQHLRAAAFTAASTTAIVSSRSHQGCSTRKRLERISSIRCSVVHTHFHPSFSSARPEAVYSYNRLSDKPHTCPWRSSCPCASVLSRRANVTPSRRRYELLSCFSPSLIPGGSTKPGETWSAVGFRACCVGL